jgi:hypothetical protein
MNGNIARRNRMPWHIRRYMINQSKIPIDSFSMLHEMIFQLMAPLESLGYLIPDSIMPDISMGKMFSQWLRENGYDPKTFDTYEHVFADGVRPTVQARLYPNKLLTDFRQYFQEKWLKERAVVYFSEKVPDMIPYLEQLILQIEGNAKKPIADK